MPPRQRSLRELMDTLLKQFDPEEAEDILLSAAEKAGVEAVARVRNEYPPEPPGKDAPTPLMTAKQWRWWWAMMRNIAEHREVPDSLRGYKAAYRKVNGVRKLVISGHYKRTGTLVRSINYDVQTSREGFSILVGPGMAREHKAGSNIASYAEYVIGYPPPEGHQAAIHQGRWKPIYDIISEASDDIIDVFFDNFIEDVYSRLQARGWQSI